MKEKNEIINMLKDLYICNNNFIELVGENKHIKIIKPKHYDFGNVGLHFNISFCNSPRQFHCYINDGVITNITAILNVI